MSPITSPLDSLPLFIPMFQEFKKMIKKILILVVCFLITNNYGETEIVWFQEQRAEHEIGRGRDFTLIHCAKIGRLPHPVAKMDSRGYFAV